MIYEKYFSKEVLDSMADSKNNPIVMIAIISVLVVILAGAVSYFVVTNVLHGKSSEKVQKQEIGPLYSLEEEIIANLADQEEEHFVKTKVALELNDKKTEKEMAERTPQIRDCIITILRSKQASDIEERDSLNKIRKEIMKKCNDTLVTGRVVNVYFTDFVMQ